MKCKVFNIRLSEEHRGADEAGLNEFLEKVIVKRIYASIQNQGPSWSILLFYGDKLSTVEEKITRQSDVSEQNILLTPDEEKIYEELRRWRGEKAGEEGIASYMIAHNRQLKQMATLPVRAKEDLLRIKGFGEKRAEKYGEEILRILRGLGDWEGKAK